MSTVRELSPRITYRRQPGCTTVVISPRLDDTRQWLLTTWIMAWTFCGIAMATQLFADHPRETKLALVVFLTFWAYYEYRIGYVWLWRRRGVELLKLEDGRLTYKRSLRTYGKAYDFYYDNIHNWKKTERKTVTSVLENSFWVIGGERLSFDYQNRALRFGVQLTDQEADKLEKFLRREIEDQIKQGALKQEQEQVS